MDQHLNRLANVPTPEDWIALQGGRPEIYFRESCAPKIGVFAVVHVYDRAFRDISGRAIGHHGMVIPTAGQHMLESVQAPDQYTIISLGDTPRHVRVPSALLIDRHGKPCEERSHGTGALSASSRYKRLGSAQEYLQFQTKLLEDGFQQVRLGVNPSGNFQLRRLHTPATIVQ